MNRDTLEGKWKQFKGSVKVQWGRLTGNNVEVIEGKGVQLSGKVQQGYGVVNEAVQEKVDNLDVKKSHKNPVADND